MTNGRRLRPRLAAALLATGLVATGCGTRLSQGEVHAQLRAAYGGQTGTEASATPGAATGTDGAGSGGTAVDPGVALGAGPDAESSGGTVVSGDDAARAPGQAAETRAAGGSKAPIVLGMEGTWTGLIGEQLATSRDAVQSWAKLVNSRGGLNGHPVEVIVTENASDAAKSIANVKELVEQRHVVALVNSDPAPGAEDAVAKYLESKNVPMIGVNPYPAAWHNSPMMFPVAGSRPTWTFAFVKAMADAGKKKVGIVYCVETTGCSELAPAFKSVAAKLGLTVVYESRVSAASPDFTAQCLQAQSNGAEALLPVLSTSGVQRFAENCDRQGYHPLIIHPTPDNDAPPALRGAIAPVQTFPWFLTSGSPAVEEYANALKQYNRNAISAWSSKGWIAAKAIEKALVNVSDTPTSQDVLNGLWSFRGETLDGLSPPLTFTQGQPAPEVKCSYAAAVQDGKWVAPLGVKPTYCVQ